MIEYETFDFLNTQLTYLYVRKTICLRILDFFVNYQSMRIPDGLYSIIARIKAEPFGYWTQILEVYKRSSEFCDIQMPDSLNVLVGTKFVGVIDGASSENEAVFKVLSSRGSIHNLLFSNSDINTFWQDFELKNSDFTEYVVHNDRVTFEMPNQVLQCVQKF